MSDAPVVVKVGGARAVDPAGALADVAALVESGTDVVLVHGGSTAVDETLDRLGVDPEYVETPDGVVGRFTDRETMDVIEMVFGRLNTELVAGLQSRGVDAVGLNGLDGRLLAGPRTSAVRVQEDGKRKIRRGDHSGRIEAVDDDLLDTLFAGGYTPVVGPPMAGKESVDEDDGEDGDLAERWLAVNTDADRTAAALAGALDARLVLLTDVAGVYADPDDPDTRIERVATPEAWAALTDAAEGFMERKVMALAEALDAGAPLGVVADANADEPIRSALSGDGTHVDRNAVVDEAGGGEATGDGEDRDGATDADATDGDEAADGATDDAGDAGEGSA